MIQKSYLQFLLINSFLIFIVNTQYLTSCLTENCLQCDNPYICTNCPAKLNCCQQSCASCVNQTVCVDCEPQFTLNISTSLCYLTESCYQVGCIECQGSRCTKCMQGFVLDNVTYECILCPLDCIICTPNRTCLKCILQFLPVNGTCQPCQGQGCIECENQGYTCTRCQLGYALFGPYCKPCPSFCEYCSSPTVCEVCQYGYYLTNNAKCKACSSTCQQGCFGAANNCTACGYDSYFSQGSCFYCYNTIPMCVSCIINAIQQVICLNCTVSMYVSANNQCLPCPQGCSSCANSTVCLTCLPSYYLNGSLCVTCTVPGCLYCLNETHCGNCATFYTPNQIGTACLACSYQCQQCSSPTKCLICSPGYSLTSGVCKVCSLNCKACTAKKCQLCNDGFYPSNIYDECLPCPTFCGDCTANDECFYCLPGSYLIGVGPICQPCSVPNCYNCNASTSRNNTNFCSLCYNGYYLSEQMNQCIPCINNCLICSNDTVCQLCNEGYFLQDEECNPCVEDCKQCKNGLTCTQCLKGFFRNENHTSCNICPIGCFQCSSMSSCSSCTLGYFLNTASLLQACIKCSYPCLTCVNSSKTCTSCALGFIINNTTCDACPLGFAICDMNFKFVECFNQYTIIQPNIQLGETEFKCVACPKYCLECHQIVDAISPNLQVVLNCTQCQVGLILLNNGSCFECGSTTQTFACQQCNDNGICTQCFKGYTLDENSICVLNQQQEIQPSNWNYIGADIGLLCLFVTLLIIFLNLKLRTPIRSSGMNMQLVQK